MRLPIKAINDVMGPNGLVPPLLLFRTLPKFSCITNIKHKQSKRFEAPKLERIEMETITDQLRIQRALQSNLPLVKEYIILQGDLARVYRQQRALCEGLFIDTKASKKILSVTDEMKVKPFELPSVLPKK